MQAHTYRTKILDAGAVAIGRPFINESTLLVDGEAAPAWMTFDYTAGMVQRTDGVGGDRTLYTFTYEWDDSVLGARDAQVASELDLAAGTEARMANVPGWATMSEAEALAYIDANVTDLASAKTVLRAMARMLVALRDKNWPGLTAGG